MAFQGDSIFWVEVNKIVPNPYQPRREFNEDKLKELAESVRMYGILQPLTVTRKEIQQDDGAFHSEYELIAGERRLRASKLAGLVQVPVIIRDSDDTEQEKLELAIIENLQREDLNAVDRALAFQQLADAFSLTHEQVAKKVGRSRMYVSNTIRLLGLREYMLDSLKVGDISEGHARTLLMLKDRLEEQDVVYREILLKKLSVREVERIVRKIATDKVRKKNWKGTDPHLIEIEKEFTDALGTRVQIAKTDFGGKLTIDYFSESDLQKLLTLMKHVEDKQESEAKNNEAPVVQSMAAVAASTPLDFSEKYTLDDNTPEDNTVLEEETPETPEIERETPEISEAPETPKAIETEERLETENNTPVTPRETVVAEEQPHSSFSALEETVSVTEEVTAVKNPFADVLEAVEEDVTEIEKEVLGSAIEAGSAVDRPTPAEQVVNSSALHEEVQEQINHLVEKEEQYTPAVPAEIAPQVEEDKDKEDDSDLYSMKNFGI